MSELWRNGLRISSKYTCGRFYCNKCNEDYELKSKKDSIGRKILDGGYEKMLERLQSSTNPNFFFLNYGAKNYQVKNFVVIKIIETLKNVRGVKKLKVKKGEIIFQETTFSYSNQKGEVFNKFNLTITAGQTVGLVRASGAGKTTITKLLLRFSNLDSGKILIDKQDIAKVTQDSLREAVSYAPQEPVLFHRFIYKTLPMGTQEQLEKKFWKHPRKLMLMNLCKL